MKQALKVVALGLTLMGMVACSTTENRSEKSQSKPGLNWTEAKSATTILNLSADRPGLAYQTLAKAGRQFTTTSGKHDAVIFNAQDALTAEAQKILDEAVKNKILIIVDSDGSEGGAQRVSSAVLTYGGIGLAADAVVITPRGDGAASVTPFETAPAVQKQSNGEETPTSNPIQSIASVL